MMTTGRRALNGVACGVGLAAGRRRFLAGLLSATGVALLWPVRRLAAETPRFVDRDLTSLSPLRQTAESRNLTFGAFSQYRLISKEVDFAALYPKECAILHNGWDFMWRATHRNRDQYTFSDADWTMDFATQRNMQVGAHCLVWGQDIPDWLKTLSDVDAVRRTLQQHIQTVVGRYRGRMRHWVVVNEVFAPVPDAIYRSSYWLDRLGPSYIDIAFRAAAAADPDALLILNDTHLTADSSFNDAQRRKVLDQLKSFKAAGTPIHALGIQGHIKASEALNGEKVRAFVHDVGALGLKVLLTEIDVLDNTLPYDFTVRDEIVAQLYFEMLGGALTEPAVDAVITWGLIDRQSWYNAPNAPASFRRTDGQPNRPLPYDDQLKRKACWAAVSDALKGASTG
jgi:endo-1,4-beta-xylanase